MTKKKTTRLTLVEVLSLASAVAYDLEKVIDHIVESHEALNPERLRQAAPILAGVQEALETLEGHREAMNNQLPDVEARVINAVNRCLTNVTGLARKYSSMLPTKRNQ